MTDQFIVTITPPTPNGDLHIGHIAGPFLSADIFARTQRQKGAHCYLVSYSDDYQSYLRRKAMEMSGDEVALAKENSAKIQQSLRMVGIEVDYWLESYQNPYFEDAARMLYEQGLESGLIQAKPSVEPYCEQCEVWGYEAFARGACNHCGTSSDPSQCESCAMAPNALEMKDLKCILCKQAVSHRPVERKFLTFSKVAPALRERLARSPMRAQLRTWIDDAFARGVLDWGVTRPDEAGLKLYDDEAHRVHTWFMGQAGYFAALKALSESNEQARDAYAMLFSDKTRMVNFLGMDCSYSHVLAYPAQVLLNEQFKFSNAFYTNAFLKLDGEDFSTSRGHAIWVRDLVGDACSDSVRFYVSLNAPEEQTENFSAEEFWAWRKRIFVELLPKISSVFFDPAHAARPGDAVLLSDFERAIVEQWQQCSRHDNFSTKRIAQVLMAMLEALESDIAQGQARRNLIVLFTLLCAPTLPQLASVLRSQISEHELAAFSSLLGLE
ncbi:methionine--tRNA ligase [Pseudomonas alkylphenolica]|nr:methionine--tRNA ligase [Pseudomonas sp. 5]